MNVTWSFSNKLHNKYVINAVIQVIWPKNISHYIGSWPIYLHFSGWNMQRNGRLIASTHGQIGNQGVSTLDISSQKMHFVYTNCSFDWTDRNVLRWEYSISCNQMNIGEKSLDFIFTTFCTPSQFSLCFHWVGCMKMRPYDVISIPWCTGNGGTHGAVY